MPPVVIKATDEKYFSALDTINELRARVRDLEEALVRTNAELNNAAITLHGVVGKMIRTAADGMRTIDEPDDGTSDPKDPQEKQERK